MCAKLDVNNFMILKTYTISISYRPVNTGHPMDIRFVSTLGTYRHVSEVDVQWTSINISPIRQTYINALDMHFRMQINFLSSLVLIYFYVDSNVVFQSVGNKQFFDVYLLSYGGVLFCCY